ncbi:Acetyl-CoA acetyltransferase [Pseudonocardia thermophila]|uniref:Acetyl-CoA acetyltransferase n=1 Tax=Pseudonocardia thermophila TaxID=1848 RepID=A0A1M6T7D5_PSETH|nr:thiolase family protein [Pseudonocardia thermophila]SHK52759.1 Acetyl-CoA acetyltransferase [Pseudonocardia thermophila]
MKLQDVAIVGVGVTPQVKRSEKNSLQVALDAAKLALADAGLSHTDLDGIAARWPGPGGTELAPGSADWSTMLGVPLSWIGDSYPQGIPALVDAAGAILTGQATTILITGGQAGVLGGGKVASYTRPGNEFVAPFGAFTAAHFALVAQRHLARFPYARQGMAEIAATIRNVGSTNPDAVMYGRGPYTAEDVLAAPPVVDPFTLLDLCLASEGGAAVVVTTLERARDLRHPPVVLLGAGMEWLRQQYVDPARYEEVWSIGAKAARKAFGQAGLGPSDVDVAQLYDVNSLEVARQFEALGFCGEGEGTDFALATGIGPDGKLPTCTDGGLLSFSHIGWGAPTLKLVEAVHQVRGTAGARQIPGAEVALAAGAGSAAQYYNLALLGRAR